VDRISALRNVEDALRRFENGEIDLLATEREVATILRTYATEFESDEAGAAYRAVRVPDDAGTDATDETGDAGVAETVVVAGSRAEARDRLAELFDLPAGAAFEVERLE
jgi:hypothetical protein